MDHKNLFCIPSFYYVAPLLPLKLLSTRLCHLAILTFQICPTTWYTYHDPLLTKLTNHTLSRHHLPKWNPNPNFSSSPSITMAAATLASSCRKLSTTIFVAHREPASTTSAPPPCSLVARICTTTPWARLRRSRSSRIHHYYTTPGVATSHGHHQRSRISTALRFCTTLSSNPPSRSSSPAPSNHELHVPTDTLWICIVLHLLMNLQHTFIISFTHQQFEPSNYIFMSQQPLHPDAAPLRAWPPHLQPPRHH